MRRFHALAVVALFVRSAVGLGATFDVPTATEAAVSSGINTPYRNAPRAYQEYVDATELAGLAAPVHITGIQYRLAIGEDWRPTAAHPGSSWPELPISFTQYDVQLSASAGSLAANGSYSSLTPTFASHQAADVTTVRIGPLSVAANAFTADGGSDGIHAFGPVIAFTTPYLYEPGNDLIIMIRHSGFTGGVVQANFASRSNQQNVAGAISHSSNASAASPNSSSAPAFVRLTYEVPEPGCGTIVMAALALLRRPRVPRGSGTGR